LKELLADKCFFIITM